MVLRMRLLLAQIELHVLAPLPVFVQPGSQRDALCYWNADKELGISVVRNLKHAIFQFIHIFSIVIFFKKNQMDKKLVRCQEIFRYLALYCLF